LSELNSFYNAVIFGTLLCAADKIGVKPMLLGRQAATILKPLLETLAKQALGKKPPSNMEELLTYFKEMGKTGGTSDPEKSETSFSENCLHSKVVNCMYLKMAEYGKSIGYTSCPLCATGILAMSLISALGFGEVSDFKVETSGNTCVTKMLID